jgi:hypothetical protein
MWLRYNIKACRPMCILEKGREDIGSIWSMVTCLALPLGAAQSLEHRAPGDSRSLRRLIVAIGNRQHKLSYLVFMPKPSTQQMYDPGSIVPHIRPKVFTDNQMSRMKYKYYYINSVLKTVIPRSEIAGTKPPYVCPGCFIHTYSNNMINRFHVQ